MPRQITLLNFSAATVIMQVALGVIVMCGIFMLQFANPLEEQTDFFGHRRFVEPAHLYALTVIMLLVSLVLLGLSADFFSLWKPLASNLSFVGLPTQAAIRLVFLADIVFVGILLVLTGGSRFSAFSPMCFTLPPLAIFLHQPFPLFLMYVVLLAIVFTATIRPHYAAYGRNNTFCYWSISLMCVSLSTIIAYVTQPV